MKNTPQVPWLLVVGFLLLSSSCRREAQAGAAVPSAASKAGPAPAAAAAAPIALQAAQEQLLTTAFAAASKFPLEPHGKNRSRAQQVVVVACFELGALDLAVTLASDIRDWRRALGYADFAWEMAKRGERSRAEQYLGMAAGVVEAERKNEAAQEWRGDLIALKMSRAWRELGELDKAQQVTAGIDVSSSHAVDTDWASTVAARAKLIPADGAASELSEIDKGFPSMSLGQQAAALALIAALHERFFADTALRAACEERPAVRFNKMAPTLRLDTLSTMVRTSCGRGELAAAQRLLGTMRNIVEGHRWRPEDLVPWRATLVELTFLAGLPDQARSDLETALVAYHRERDGIVNIYRAETLRPLALAKFVVGDASSGQALLAQVLEEAIENPNSRPRCDDLVDTLVAMARRAIAPTAELQRRIDELVAGLGEPW